MIMGDRLGHDRTQSRCAPAIRSKNVRQQKAHTNEGIEARRSLPFEVMHILEEVARPRTADHDVISMCVGEPSEEHLAGTTSLPRSCMRTRRSSATPCHPAKARRAIPWPRTIWSAMGRISVRKF